MTSEAATYLDGDIITIPRKEYDYLKESATRIKLIEEVLHKDSWDDLLAASETVAKELWDNKDDEVWNNI